MASCGTFRSLSCWLISLYGSPFHGSDCITILLNIAANGTAADFVLLLLGLYLAHLYLHHLTRLHLHHSRQTSAGALRLGGWFSRVFLFNASSVCWVVLANHLMINSRRVATTTTTMVDDIAILCMARRGCGTSLSLCSIVIVVVIFLGPHRRR
jgi:hypothetical protein